MSEPSAPPEPERTDPAAPRVFQTGQPAGVPPLELTGERTLPDVPEENYWFRATSSSTSGSARASAACASSTWRAARATARTCWRGPPREVVGVDANPEAFEHAGAKYARPGVRFERTLIDAFAEPRDAVVFLQTIEHVTNPGEILGRFAGLLGPGRRRLRLDAQRAHARARGRRAQSGNPWHVHEYRAEEFRALLRAQFGDVELLGLFHARKLRAHEVALERLGWDARPRRGSASPKPLLRLVHAGDLRARLRAARARPRSTARSTSWLLSAVSGRRRRVSLVLHTHMPYVEGFGTWPFGEEWLWEAIATSYLPLLGLLDARRAADALADPVLCDQLAAPGALERCPAFLRERARRLAPPRRRRPARGRRGRAADELERAAGRVRSGAARALEAIERATCSARSAPHAAWTRQRHPRDAAAARHRRRRAAPGRDRGRVAPRTASAHWRGGFWLPECAHEPWLDVLLEEAGVHATCVDLTDVFGAGDPRHLPPLRTRCRPAARPDRPRD